jgi:hypothetical protein
MTDERRDRGIRRVIWGAYVCLAAIPIAALGSLALGASPVFLVGYAIAAVLLILGIRGLRRGRA